MKLYRDFPAIMNSNEVMDVTDFSVYYDVNTNEVSTSISI